MHRYTVLNGKIGYKDQDTINTNITYGYNTMWAHFEENRLGEQTTSHTAPPPSRTDALREQPVH
jgi:hypothetical protein